MSDLGLARRFDPGFRRAVAWDIALLDGYDSEFIKVREGHAQESFFWLSLRSNFTELLKARKITKLWIQGWQVAAYWQAVWTAKRMGAEIWLRAETNLRSSSNGIGRIVKRALRKRLLDHVDWALYIGEANRKFYLAHGMPAARMLSAPYCVDNNRFAAQASQLRPEREALRKKWRIPNDAFCFLFMGKFVPKKRPMDLIEAVRRLTQSGSGPSPHILFVGAGELEREMRQRCTVLFDAESKGVCGTEGPHASFAGFLNQTEISQAYVVADCLVLPSDATETWGLVVNEAMASGLPCVVSDACGCVEDLIHPVRRELSYPVGDTGLLQRSLRIAIEDSPSRGILQRHIKHYDILRTVSTIEELYESCAGC